MQTKQITGGWVQQMLGFLCTYIFLVIIIYKCIFISELILGVYSIHKCF